MSIQEDAGLREKKADVTELPVWRKSPLLRRARLRNLRKDIYPPLPDSEPKLHPEHWVIGSVIAGSFVAAVIALILS